MQNNDLISRSAAIEQVERREKILGGSCLISTRSFKNFLMNRPAADAEPVRHAKWHYMRVTRYNMPIDCRIRCANCGAIFARLDGMNYRFCPDCGAKMDGDKDAAD